MTNEQKQLLLTDLCARLLYGVKIHLNLPDTMENGYTLKEINTEGETVGVVLDRGESLSRFKAVRVENEYGDLCVKPYLRPMSSMTEEEEEESKQVIELELKHLESGESGHTIISAAPSAFEIDFYNKHHFDYRGLIPMGLALEAKEGMYD